MSLTPTKPSRPLFWPAAVEAIRAVLSSDEEVYIVGGAVRDAYLQRPLHDIDLCTAHDGCPVARKIANAFNGAYYPLDQTRGVGRAIITWEQAPLVVDVAQFRGPDLRTDLVMRDFTVNAMAVKLTGDLQSILDPTGGLNDINTRLLRRCSSDSIDSDPVRALRAIRASTTLSFRIEPQTLQDLQRAGKNLATASIERVRDELFQIFDSAHTAAALEAMKRVGLLEYVLPELANLIGIAQTPPHQHDVWTHTLKSIEQLENLITTFTEGRNDNLTANIQLGAVVFAFGELRPHLHKHLMTAWPNKRTHKSLLKVAAALHDCGKPDAQQLDDQGRTHFYRHEQIGALLAQQRAQTLRLSNEETDRLRLIVENHMRPIWLSTADKVSRRTIYRFWRATGSAGVDVCLLSLADYLATYGTTLDTQRWLSFIDLVRTLLNSFFLHHDTEIAPPALINGQHLTEHLRLKPGPQIGELLERIREAQISGEITNQEEALAWAQRFLQNTHNL